MKAKNLNLMFIATTSFVFPLFRHKQDRVKLSKQVRHSVFQTKKKRDKLTGLGLSLFRYKGQLSPVSAAGVELPPFVEGGDPWGEHDVKLF